MYAVIPAALIWWAWQRRRQFKSPATCEPEGIAGTRKMKRFVLWVVIAMIGSAGLVVLGLLDTNWKVQRMTSVEVQKLVIDGRGKEAEFSVMQQQNGRRHLWITLRDNGERAKFIAPVDEATLALLKKQGIKCPTHVQGRDYEVFGWPGRLLFPFCIFILAIGGPCSCASREHSTRRKWTRSKREKCDRWNEWRTRYLAQALRWCWSRRPFLLGLITRWGIRTISGAEARPIIAEHKDIHCDMFQYNNGTKELWLTLRGSWHHPNFIAPADASTLALLAEQGIAYRTSIQGRDFGFRGPSRWLSLLCISVLAVGAAFILRWAWKKER